MFIGHKSHHETTTFKAQNTQNSKKVAIVKVKIDRFSKS